jgi:dihydrodipicolinate synthase/N-acetylneuraminate lyase
LTIATADTVRLKAALSKWITKPLTGIVVLGSNGEAAMDDFTAIRRSSPRATPFRAKTFIVGTAASRRKARSRAMKRAAGHGADAVRVRRGFSRAR